MPEIRLYETASNGVRIYDDTPPAYAYDETTGNLETITKVQDGVTYVKTITYAEGSDNPQTFSKYVPQ